MEQKSVVPIGAGVTDLTTVLLLSKILGYKVVVAAKHMPGDYDIDFVLSLKIATALGLIPQLPPRLCLQDSARAAVNLVEEALGARVKL
ncbi:hypothetical protein BBP40_005868 [Aspergillus hancockii]|nr:hypothetical protein BBP40_005868 [Aspergillus hancockii]